MDSLWAFITSPPILTFVLIYVIAFYLMKDD